MRKRNPWAFKIDYAKEIAYDEAQIALLTDPMFVAVCATITGPIGWQNEIIGVFQWATMSATGWLPLAECEQRAAMVDLTLADLNALAFYLDCYEAPPFQAPIVPGTYKRGETLATTRFVNWVLCTDTVRRTKLSKARADLARHKRNATKYDGK